MSHARVGPEGRPPKGPRRGSLHSIQYNDTAMDEQPVGSVPQVRHG